MSSYCSLWGRYIRHRTKMTSYIGPSKGAVLQVSRFLIVSTVMTFVSIKYQNSRAKYAGDEKTRINQPQGHAALLGTNIYDNM